MPTVGVGSGGKGGGGTRHKQRGKQLDCWNGVGKDSSQEVREKPGTWEVEAGGSGVEASLSHV